MPHEPDNAPVPDKSKRSYYIGLVVAIIVVGALAVFLFPNLLALTNEGPAVEDELIIRVPSEEGLEPVD
ncbi:hypothetical protein JSE7799_00102 [Jannaschia seosinensis]|uniref:Uncharacterized protein n=1 Tax=Jannaschia seosinensis TaxID=313367 RepID=A0A0M7B532_9RHOB|nr:hypothetical protein [Jannaschia seosinensis]CUH09508.1 hypothetical protein JSE7799_00102 [Jannaschia seosinensis]